MGKTNIIFDLPVSPWIVGALALLVLAAVIVWTVRDLARIKLFTRIAVIVLTIAGTLLAIGLLLNPRLVREWPDPQKPMLYILADDSRSMSLTDSYKGPEADYIRSAQVQTPGAQGGEVARVDLERSLLNLAPGTWLADVSRAFDVQLWGFAGGAKKLPLEGASTAFRVDEEGQETAIGNVLEFINAGGDEAGQRTPAAIVLITDGAWNAGSDPAESARALGLRNIPVYPIGLGNPEPPLDASVLSLRGPQESLLGDMLFLQATVMATSAVPMRLTLELLDGGRVVAEQPVVTLPGARPLQVEMSYEPRTAGRRTFIARVRPTEDLPNLGKKYAETTVEIVDRKIRVLLIDAEPRWEFRFIRSVLERDPGVTPTICLLRPGVGPIRGPGYLAELPTDKKDFADYDLIFLGDVPRDLLPDAFLKELADMVRIRGGSLALIAGRRQNYRNLVGTPLEDILPVLLTRTPAAGERTVKLELTQEGASHLLTRLSPDAAENDRIWDNLPAMGWSADVAGLTRGATMLLANANQVAGTGHQPILAIQYVGAGKTLFSGVEETWRWRKSVGDKYHYRFWAQAIRWLIRKHFNEGDRLCRLSLSRVECNVGEKVEVEAYCLDNDGYPLTNADVSVLITPEKGEPQRMALAAAPGGWGIYRGTFIPQQEGQLKFNPIVAKYGQNPLDSKAILQVLRPDLEKSFLAQDVSALKTIAAASGGKYNTIADTGELKSLLTAKAGHRMLTEEYAPFRNRIYYAVLALVLSAAWFLRKRTGLA
ncbi:MAG: hypothetical protein ACLQVA_07015 [Candidatus Brocadiia bacterium]